MTKTLDQVESNIAEGKTPSRTALKEYTKQLVEKLAENIRGAPLSLKDSILTEFEPFWDVRENVPGMQEMTAQRLARVLQGVEQSMYAFQQRERSLPPMDGGY